MRLYHGTSYGKGTSILKERRIKSDGTESIYNGTKETCTETGFVYLTNSLLGAIHFGENVCHHTKDTKVMVFELEIPDSKLLIDYDQYKMHYKYFSLEFDLSSIEDSLTKMGCVRVAGDILLEKHLVQYGQCSSVRFGIANNHCLGGTFSELQEQRDILSIIQSWDNKLRGQEIIDEKEVVSRLKWEKID